MKLNPISNKIYKFIKSYPGDYHLKLSSVTKRLVLKLIQGIRDAEQSWRTLQYNSVENLSYLQSELFESSIPSQIKHYIKNLRTSANYSYEFMLGERKIQLHVCIPNVDGNMKDAVKYSESCLKMVYLWLHLAQSYANTSCSQEMTVYLYLTDFLKNKVGGEPMTHFHANTAYTYSCSPKTEMFIFREEEWFKVFIHETMHNLGLDFSEIDVTGFQQLMSKQFCVKSKFELFETYNETWAEFIYLVFVVVLSNGDNGELNRNSQILQKFENLLNIEINFSLFQCYKVLQHYDMKYIDLFLNPVVKTNNYSEETNVFCYYVLHLFLFKTPILLDKKKKSVKSTVGISPTIVLLFLLPFY